MGSQLFSIGAILLSTAFQIGKGKEAPALEVGAEDSPSRHELPSKQDCWRVQIYLDSICFSPGKLDGALGEFTVKAIEQWIAAKPGRNVRNRHAHRR